MVGKHLYKTGKVHTIKQWLRSIIDEETRTAALYNHLNKPMKLNSSHTANKLSQALSRAFHYSDSPEGETFWIDLARRVLKQEADFDTIEMWSRSKDKPWRYEVLEHVLLTRAISKELSIAEVVKMVASKVEEEPVAATHKKFTPNKF